MSNASVHRRAFLATSTLALPALAFASGTTKAASTAEPMEFEDLMKQVGRNLKTVRKSIASLKSPADWDDASFYSNEITILLAQCIAAAEQVHIPPQAKAKYAGDKAQFTTDLRLKLAEGVKGSADLSIALWQQDEQAAKAKYNALRSIRNHGHDEFQDEDDDD